MWLVKPLTIFNKDQFYYNASSGMWNVNCENVLKHVQSNVSNVFKIK